MADRVVLHIGTMKSGTTYLQDVLTSGILDGTGAFFAGGTFGAQTRAVRHRAQWRALAREGAARPGVAVYSQEFLSFARPGKVRRLVRVFDGAPVDVVLTVRDQHNAIPAQWQSYCRNRGTDDWPTYVGRLHRTRTPGGGQPRAAHAYYRSQGVATIVDRWVSDPGVRTVSVVLVPPSGADPVELWRRFCAATDLDLPQPPAGAVRSNESLGYASCDLLRRLTPRLRDLGTQPYRRLRKRILEALLPLRPAEQRPVLDRAGEELARELNAAIVDRVTRDDVRLVGSTSELRLEDRGTAPASIPPPAPGEVRRAAEALWDGCLPDEPRPADDLDALVDALGARLLESVSAPRVAP